MTSRSVTHAIVALAFAAGCASAPPSSDESVPPPVSEEWVSLLSGTWGWGYDEATCAADPHQISFSRDRMFMDVGTRHRRRDPEEAVIEAHFRYRIISATRHPIRMQIEAENEANSERDDSGRPVVWDLVMRGRDEYRLHRGDWRSGELSPQIRRCD